jgi:hypothetical protein
MATRYRTYYYKPAKLTYGDLDLKSLMKECDIDFAHYTYGKNQCTCCYGPRQMPKRFWRNGKIAENNDFEYILFKNAYNCGGSKKPTDTLACYPEMYTSSDKEHIFIAWRINTPEKLKRVKKALEKQVGSEFKVEIPDDDRYCILLTRKTITKKEYATKIVDAYIDAISNGVTTGYGLLRTLSDKQRKMLVKIASAVTGRKMTYFEFEDFTIHAKRVDPEFDKYVENVNLAREDLINIFSPRG